ncbi:BLUF domain-containing protein [Sphingomonas sp. S1-29]|uniref:BLUF domain-containing protein n=1 Tax=Sphingomonas sp. S1-29 TaxID=2991074 RepID=UPI00223F5B06|nr:BLUF domain-containing protein [Sphingomonas sp. S1-29]UZK69060.1 BLUF domain-containing protein [Sphingomonas sp. S1-29]
MNISDAAVRKFGRAMPTFRLIYASRSVIAPEQAEGVIEAIVDVSRIRNRNVGVTGCLILAGGRFAQVLEGEQHRVEDIMASICRDVRHTDIGILEQKMVPQRRFSAWSLGYAGPSSFVKNAIVAQLARNLRGSPRSIEALLRMMDAFCAEPVPPDASPAKASDLP